MKKNRYLYVLLSGLILILSSCVRTEESLFEESAALRLNRAIANDRKLLSSADNGWVMEYFPTNGSPGFVLLIRFDSSGIASIAAKNEVTPMYDISTGTWNMIDDSGPVLTFDTYNAALHVFSDPNSGYGQGLGIGLAGDYEFIIMNASETEFTLKGKKRGTNIRLYRFPEKKEWRSYFADVNKVNALFNVNIPYLHLTVNGSRVMLTGGHSHIFNIETASDYPVEIPFIVTDEGIRFAQPFETNGVSVQKFRLSDDGNSLWADENAIAKIELPLPQEFFVATLQTKKWAIDTTSAGLRGIIDSVYAGLNAVNRTLVQLDFRDLSDSVALAVQVKSTATGVTAIGRFYYSVKPTEDGIEFAYKGTSDTGGDVLRRLSGFSELLQALDATFKIDSVNSTLNPSVLTLENTADTSLWFVLKQRL
ncbi:MAG: DUF4302 domain-containing protein [Dysgonamonadaceae bacterium]|jgi:hypothetical protein|nr:DUF4302 domain-containing protein [Dysgonamonadaceae bacterium]